MSAPTPATGKVAVITGADSGIGRATAVRLARAGMDIGITWHRDHRGAEETAEEVRAHGRRAEVAPMDLTRLPDAADTVDELCDRLGRIDVLANNAGTGTMTPFLIATPMTGQEDTDPHAERRPGVPLGRPGDAREVAAVIAFLAGPDASYVTGASWSVDGGMLRMGPQAGSHLTNNDWRRP
ncbi:SDR family oxidoreductase [Streptomyces prasinus]|uniref:SDR family oxidoreductase n=1 Tax=Streptomyces prasinus TaxID=67345 RepID=UPI00367A057E